MSVTSIILNSKDSPIAFEIETGNRIDLGRFFKLKIFRLPEYKPKPSTNEVIDIGYNHLLGFLDELAIGMGTFRLALPSLSSKDKLLTLTFDNDFLLEMSDQDLLNLQIKIASTLNFLNQKLSQKSDYLDTIFL